MALFSNRRQEIPKVFLAKIEIDAKIAELMDFKVIHFRDIPTLKWHLVPLKNEQQRLRAACEAHIKSSRANS